MSKLDLTKSQLILENIKVRVWDDDKSQSEVGYIALIDHRDNKPYHVWTKGWMAKDHVYCYSNTTAYKNAELIKTRYKHKEFYDLVETLKEQGYEQDHCGHFFSKTGFAFFKEMFNYCGQDYDPDDHSYTWRKEWLEEINES